MQDKVMSRDAANCAAPWCGDDEYIALAEDIEQGEFKVSTQAIPLSDEDVKYISEKRCICCEFGDSEEAAENIEDALATYDWLNTHSPKAYVLVEVENDRHGRYRLYLVPAKVWDKVKVDLLPDCAD